MLLLFPDDVSDIDHELDIDPHRINEPLLFTKLLSRFDDDPHTESVSQSVVLWPFWYSLELVWLCRLNKLSGDVFRVRELVCSVEFIALNDPLCNRRLPTRRSKVFSCGLATSSSSELLSSTLILCLLARSGRERNSRMDDRVLVLRAGSSYFGMPLKNHAPVFFHISRVSEHILHSQIILQRTRVGSLGITY